MEGKSSRTKEEKARNAKASESIADSVKLIRERLPTKSSEHPFS
jgi:hypothetical protein